MNPLKPSCALFALLSLVSPIGQAADLIDIFQLGEANDPQFKQVLATHRATLETLPQAKALLLPSLSASANTRYNDQDISTNGFGASGEVGFNSRGYSLNLTQTLFRWDQFLAIGQSESQIQQSAANVEAARQELMVRVAGRYFNALRAQDDIEFARASEVSLGRRSVE